MRPRARLYSLLIEATIPTLRRRASEFFMSAWLKNVLVAIKTVAQGMYVTLWYFFQTYRRNTFTQRFEYPELPVPVKPRYRGFHRFDLTTCIACDKCAGGFSVQGLTS